jgi:hypothetical protein
MASAMAFCATLIRPRSKRLVLDDANVMLDRGTLGDAVDQRGEIGDAADGFHFLAAVELLDQRDHVDRTTRLLQVAHARINAAVRVQREMVAGEMFGGLIVKGIVEQDRAQDGAFSLDAYGQSAVKTVIGGCHRVPPI